LFFLGPLLANDVAAAQSAQCVTGEDRQEQVSEALSRMNLRQKIGQLIMTGYSSVESAERSVSDLGVGSLVAFERNWDPARHTKAAKSLEQWATSFRTEIDALQELAIKTSGVPLLVAVDQEGGRMIVFEKDITVFPPSMAVAATRDPPFARFAGETTARQLRQLGVNMNLAPVVDIRYRSDDMMIADRSYSSEPSVVLAFALQFADGLSSGGMISTVKHFPGHGQVRGDPHVELPTISSNVRAISEHVSMFTALRRSLPPCSALMTSHVLFDHSGISQLNGQMLTVSQAAISRMIRPGDGSLHGDQVPSVNFKGVLITDDITMGAVTKYNERMNWSIAQFAAEAIFAGHDVVMIAHLEQLALPRSDGSTFLPEDEADFGVLSDIHTAIARRLCDLPIGREFPLESDCPGLSRVNERVSRVVAAKLSLSPTSPFQPEARLDIRRLRDDIDRASADQKHLRWLGLSITRLSERQGSFQVVEQVRNRRGAAKLLLVQPVFRVDRESIEISRRLPADSLVRFPVCYQGVSADRGGLPNEDSGSCFAVSDADDSVYGGKLIERTVQRLFTAAREPQVASIVFGVVDESHALLARRLHDEMSTWPNPPSVVLVTLRSPDIVSFAQFSDWHWFSAYGNIAPSWAGLAMVLNGEQLPGGRNRLPVRVNDVGEPYRLEAEQFYGSAHKVNPAGVDTSFADLRASPVWRALGVAAVLLGAVLVVLGVRIRRSLLRRASAGQRATRDAG
jgi:beta-N-acetylhexosaminidase